MRSKREAPTEQQVTEAFRALANEHAAEREPFDKRRAWHALQYAHRTLRAPARSARVRWALALGVFALGLAVGAPAWQAWTMLRYEAHGLASEGSNLNAGETPADLAFSDGSRITASPHTTLSVDLLGKRAALTRLIDGRLHVAVRHEPDTNYRFLAGPYEVQVVGTEFDLEWHARADGFTLVMQSGEVRVLGEGNPRQVRGGETLRLPVTRETAPEPARAALPASPSALAPASHDANRGSKPSGALARAPEAADWNALLNAGQFSAIMRD